MTGHHAVRRRAVRASDVEFVVLEAGTGLLALCLHGFPDADADNFWASPGSRK